MGVTRQPGSRMRTRTACLYVCQLWIFGWRSTCLETVRHRALRFRGNPFQYVCGHFDALFVAYFSCGWKALARISLDNAARVSLDKIFLPHYALTRLHKRLGNTSWKSPSNLLDYISRIRKFRSRVPTAKAKGTTLGECPRQIINLRSPRDLMTWGIIPRHGELARSWPHELQIWTDFCVSNDVSKFEPQERLVPWGDNQNRGH